MKNGLLDFLQGASNSVAGNVAGPVDLISMGLLKMGVPVGSVPMGGSEWMKQKGLMRDVPQGPARVLGETAGLLGPAMATQFAPKIAGGLLKGADNLSAPTTLNTQAGMIKTPFGRIPETSKEIDGFYDQLRTKADALGYKTSGGSSNVSGSRYLTFSGSEAADGSIPSFQVRLSNHGDRYPNSLDADARFSVDPDSGNTFEMAKSWLKENGFDLGKRATQKMPDWVARKPEYAEVFPEAIKEMEKLGLRVGGDDGALGTIISLILERNGQAIK